MIRYLREGVSQVHVNHVGMSLLRIGRCNGPEVTPDVRIFVDEGKRSVVRILPESLHPVESDLLDAAILCASGSTVSGIDGLRQCAAARGRIEGNVFADISASIIGRE